MLSSIPASTVNNMDPIQKLDSSLNQPWTAAQSRAQFAALAKLRWCIFRNAFRRKGGAGELAARIVLFPIIGVFAIGPIAAAGFGAYYLTAGNRLDTLHLLTWAVFALWLVVLLNISPPGLSFDINTILRFPISFPRYLAARLLFGILSAANIIGTLALVAADIGIAIARPSLALWATFLLGTFALTNIFFTRMMLVWVERWLSTRRAREVFTALFLFASLGFQYINLNYNPGFKHAGHRSSTLPFLVNAFHHIRPIAAFLPPGLTASSIAALREGHLLAAIAALLGLIAFSTLFFGVYALRMHREFRGENLSESSQRNQPATHRSITPATRPTSLSSPAPIASTRFGTLGLNSAAVACLQKELIYLRRNINQLYGFIAPVFMVFIFANRIGSSGRFGDFIFPLSVAYSVLGVSILSYNALGVDGPGVQFYFMAPTRMRDVFLAKNLIGFLLNLVELVLIFAVILFVARTPSLLITLATVCWLLFATFINGAIGNLRSIAAPKKVDLLKASRRQASQLSVLIALGILVACAGTGAAVILLASYLNRQWVMLPILFALALASFIFYLTILNRLDTIALDHRETLSEELCKA
jgi:ABC-2 type transport system permease protein